ncbi:hypothetical protein DV736_g254, partial [Chaetothyriales sp. CBS 134916]
MTNQSRQPGDLNGHSGFILAVFCLVSIFVIYPIKIPLPRIIKRILLSILVRTKIIDEQESRELSACQHSVWLSLTTAPVIGVILLLATTTINGTTIQLGIVGDDNVKPYDVLVLFISLAYISIALDGTGALEAIAFYVSKRGGNSGRLLFAYLYGFFLLTGCIVGNDPLIMSGTPFLAYLTHHTGLEPTAWVFSEFMAANTASAVLVSSNPTNILIAGSFELNFLTGFTKWTILPSIIPAAVTYPILLAMFWNKIPKKLEPLTEDPWLKLRDKTGALFLSVLMLVTVAVLVGTSFVPGHAVQVWMVTAPAGVLGFVFNVMSDWLHPDTQRESVRRQSSDKAADTHPIKQVSIQTNRATSAVENSGPEILSSPSSVSPKMAAKEADQSSRQSTLTSVVRSLAHRFPGTTRTVIRLPIALLPFAMCEFILVRGLAQRGWISTFAHGFANACTDPAKTVFFMGFVSAACLCPLAGTNIGATIILVEIMRDPAFAESGAVMKDSRIMAGAIYSVAMGSNIGAFSYTFAGSLAGLLWRSLLADKAIHVSQLKFGLVNAIPLLMQITLASTIVLGELYWFY